MNEEELGFDPNAFAEPKTEADLIALALEVRAEFGRIREHMRRILACKDACAAA